MATTAEHLRTIKTFEQLLPYLEAELDWPLEEYGFDELTFEYAPEELGLKVDAAAKVKTIRQLRPLRGGQPPWGIFFIEFERKRLPVAVLRRILNHLARKKRASANRADRVAFEAGDLLFISLFGEETSDQREIAFAHFYQATGDSVTLQVLDWDGADTPLKLAAVAATLQRRLRWPDDPQDAEAWREHWRGAFRHRLRHVIKTADALVETLAALARGIRDAALTLLRHESAQGPWQKLLKAFQTALIHDLTEERFADTYAQTITYGLLTAAISRTEMSEGRHGTALLAENVADIVPVTNPFLKEMLQTFLTVGGRRGGIDFDELGIQDVVELLRSDETDLPAVLRDFGNRTQGEDPVIHFYEHFLSAYDKKLKVERGVFYTPQPVVSYIVRSVHELLQTEFGLEDGLASTVTWGEMAQRHPSPSGRGAGGEGGLSIPDGVSPDSPFVQILDPATGTATFLVEVIEVIHRTLTAKWEQQRLNGQQRLAAWNAYVPEHLLPRLYGYELMMAPYAIAHMKIGLKLHETGYRFQSEERVRVYLTNALEPASDVAKQQQFEELAPALAHEAQAVNAVKRNQRFTVVVGNPPYAGHSVNNQIPWIVDKVYDYKRGLPDLQKPGQAKWLQDDYVKFFRLSELAIRTSGIGVVGLITNHRFLDNPTFRGMRRTLCDSFQIAKFLDLHGNTKRRELSQGVERDENVFDIQQGVAISLLARGNKHSVVHFAELWGTREAKYSRLNDRAGVQIKYAKIAPVADFYLFLPQNADLRTEYEHGFSIHKVMGENGDPAPGIVTTHDEFAVAFTKAEMHQHIEALLKSSSEEEARRIFRLCTQSQWNYSNAKQELSRGNWESELCRILYRPFDNRWTVFNPHVAVHRRERVMRHLRGINNLALITTRSVEIGRGFEHVFCSRSIIQHHTVSLKEVNFVIPLYLVPGSEKFGFSTSRQINLSADFLARLSRALNLPQEQKDKLPAGLTPENIFYYVYAVFHSPSYRARYAEFLKIDFPRLPLTASLDLFRALSQLGGELVALHLMEYPKLDQHLTAYTGPAAPVVEKVSWTNDTVWLDKAQKTGFLGVPENVWNFHIGGYQVCNKWLKDRKGRTLTADDINHYHRIIVALSETIRLMAEIDEVIDRHGGWPGAFATSTEESS